MKLEDPLRVVVDVISTNSSLVKTAFEPLNGPISQISTIQLGSGQEQVSRLIFTLKKDLEHRINVEKDKLIFQVIAPDSVPSELAR